MRCGLATLGLITQTSGHSQGSFRNIDAMLQSVSPRLTVYDLGAVGLMLSLVGAGAATACWPSAGKPVRAASTAVWSFADVTGPALSAEAGTEDEVSSEWRCPQWEQPVTDTSNVIRPTT